MPRLMFRTMLTLPKMNVLGRVCRIERRLRRLTLVCMPTQPRSKALHDGGIVTNYSRQNETGNCSPALLLAKSRPGDKSAGPDRSLFDFYHDEFGRYWGTASHPEKVERQSKGGDSIKVLEHSDHAKGISRWLNHRGSAAERPRLPAPRLLVIYPTYHCSVCCPDCAYAAMRSAKELPAEEVSRIIDVAIENGVREIQLSGCGEPLEHTELGTLLGLLAAKRHACPELVLGIQTSGIPLEGVDLARFTETFSYIRMSLPEARHGKPGLTVSPSPSSECRPAVWICAIDVVAPLDVPGVESCTVSRGLDSRRGNS